MHWVEADTELLTVADIEQKLLEHPTVRLLLFGFLPIIGTV